LAFIFEKSPEVLLKKRPKPSTRSKIKKKKKMNSIYMTCQRSIILNNRNFYSCFHVGPFNASQSLTVANSLRRTLLSELNGVAIIALEIAGVFHEYSNIVGIKDSVLDINLNLKEIVLKTNLKTNFTHGFGFIQARGPGVVRARDIKLPSFVLCVDPNQYIATLSDEGIISIKLHISMAKPYLQARVCSAGDPIHFRGGAAREPGLGAAVAMPPKKGTARVANLPKGKSTRTRKRKFLALRPLNLVSTRTRWTKLASVEHYAKSMQITWRGCPIQIPKGISKRQGKMAKPKKKVSKEFWGKRKTKVRAGLEANEEEMGELMNT
jgi:hypothetical protein